MISIFTGITAEGTLTNSPDIAIANTAKTSQVSKRTKNQNIILTLLFISLPAISPTDLPFSLKLTTSAPKS